MLAQIEGSTVRKSLWENVTDKNQKEVMAQLPGGVFYLTRFNS